MVHMDRLAKSDHAIEELDAKIGRGDVNELDCLIRQDFIVIRVGFFDAQGPCGTTGGQVTIPRFCKPGRPVVGGLRCEPAP